MKSDTSEFIKTEYRKIANKNGFVFEESETLRADIGTNLMFNISGGVKYQNHIIGQADLNTKRIASIQKCLRTDCLSKIGKTGRHHLCFEMLGHFMLYEKGEQETKQQTISMIYEYLCNSLNLDNKRIWATVHPQDKVSREVLSSLEINNIIHQEDNTFVSPYAEKSSFRVEFLWQKIKEKPELIELWNLVFTQFNSKDILQSPSETIALDSGGSLERLVSAIEDISNNYENSLWKGLIQDIQSSCKVKNIEDIRKLADITNAYANLLDEGMRPGNKAENYVLRKLIRTSFDFVDKLGIDGDVLLNTYFFHSPEISNQSIIREQVKLEKIKHERAITTAIAKMNELDISCENKAKRGDIKRIQSTYGLSNYRMQKYIKTIVINKKQKEPDER